MRCQPNHSGLTPVSKNRSNFPPKNYRKKHMNSNHPNLRHTNYGFGLKFQKLICKMKSRNHSSFTWQSSKIAIALYPIFKQQSRQSNTFTLNESFNHLAPQTIGWHLCISHKCCKSQIIPNIQITLKCYRHWQSFDIHKNWSLGPSY